MVEKQSALEKTLVRLVSPPTIDASGDGGSATPPVTPSSSSSSTSTTTMAPLSVPRPGRLTRQLIARCLTLLFQRAESRTLFDVLQTCLKIASDETKGKAPEKEYKVAALYLAGELFSALGQNVMSVFVEIITTTQRILKSTSLPVIVRYHALICLQKALTNGGKSLNDQLGKELLKSLRTSLASEKAGAIVRGCANCLCAMSEQTDLITSRAEIEVILTGAFKALETADYTTKRSLSRLVAQLLAFTQSEKSAPVPVTPKPTKKKKGNAAGGGGGDDDSEGEEVAAQQAASAAGATLFKPHEPFEILADQFQKAIAGPLPKLKVALLDVYASLFISLGPTWIQTHYELITKHLMEELPNIQTRSRAVGNRAQVINLRTGIALILRKVIGERMLGETAQVNAVQQICQSYIKRYPAVMPGAPPAPNKYTLVLALDEVAGLLRQLGTVPPQVAEVYDPLLRCLAHPSHSVQISAAWCLRVYCTVSPTQVTATIDKLTSLLRKDLETLGNAGDRVGAELPRRTNGHARGLAALISVVPSRPLYTSFEVSTQVLNLAVDLLKNCGNHSLAISGVEIQVAWTLLSALQSLGPGFVRLHLSQFLLLWRNALPKPTPKDSSRADGEWAFLLHVRECTLGCILAFLHHNSCDLLNLDTAKRIVALLSNTLAFVDGFTATHSYLAQEQVPGQERSALTLLDREHMLRRRVFQCFTVLSNNSAMEPLQDSLVRVALDAFAEPNRYVGSAAQAAIAAGAGTFTNLWAVQDGYAYGVTSLQRDDESFVATGEKASQFRTYPATGVTARPDQLNRDPVEVQLDALQRRPVLGATEHDPLVLFGRGDDDTPPLPPPPATAMVDAALELFASLVPYQSRDVQIAAFETMLVYSRSSKVDKNPGRRAAIQINCCVAALGALKTATQGGPGIAGRRAGGFNNDRLTTALRELLKDALLLGDSVLRAISSQSYGRLAAVAGSHAMSSQVQFLVDQVVTNRDPDARAGCALAFGTIYSEVGGLSAGPLTKTVVNVLMSLSSDPHPTVHHSALQALRLVVDAASLSYSPHVTSTLGMLVKLCMTDTHEPEGGSAGSVNLRADLPAQQAICRMISSLIGVLGPDLQDSGKVQELIYILLNEFSKDKDDDGVVVEATKATRQFSLFAPQRLDTQQWIAQLTEHLRSGKRARKVAAITGFYQLVQKQALLVSKIAGDGLVADLFAQLDIDPGIDGVREVLLSWLRQTAELSPGSWIDLCQRIMSRSAGQSAKKDAATTTTRAPGVVHDEEAATIDLGDEGASSSGESQGSRWRTQLFALQCLHQIFLVVRRSGRLEHFEAPSQGLSPQQARALMSSRVVDLIRMAFTASTAPNTEIRLEGLTVLRDVIESFKLARDPDFQEALMLEQHQAPIAAALTPAFAIDSTPEVLAAAIQVCAVFVGSGVVREVDKMGRILKQLVSALQSCQDPHMSSLADAKDLSPNAAGMLKIAVFTAWGELQVATTAQRYLVQVVKPHINVLAPFWIASLREYAKMRIDPECVTAELGLGGGGPVVVNPSLDSQYAGLAREVLLPHYKQTWHKIMQAVSILLAIDHPAIVKAMDGERLDEIQGDSKTAVNSSAFRSEPTMLFFALYGLAFEALSTGPNTTSANETAKNARMQSVALQAIKTLAKPQYSGTALLQDSTFEELCNLCYRIVLTEGVPVQAGIIDLVVGLTESFSSRLLDGVDGDASSTTTSLPEKAKLTQLLRIVAFVITRSRVQRGSTAERGNLLRSAFDAFNGIAEIFKGPVQEELYASAFYLFAELLKDEMGADLVGPTLSSLKNLCERTRSSSATEHAPVPRAVHGFLSLALNAVDGMRGRAGKNVVSMTKNSLLAATVVLTSIPPTIKVSRAVLDHMAYLLNQKIASVYSGDSDKADEQAAAAADVALTAANCARSILVASERGTPVLQYSAGQVLPGLVEYTVGFDTSVRSAKDARVAVLTEVFKALEGFAGALPESHCEFADVIGSSASEEATDFFFFGSNSTSRTIDSHPGIPGPCLVGWRVSRGDACSGR